MMDQKLKEPNTNFKEIGRQFIAIFRLKKLVKTREKTSEKTSEKILALVKENPKITTEEMAVKTGLSIKGIEWNLSKLKKKGLLERVGPDKGGYWKVKWGEEMKEFDYYKAYNNNGVGFNEPVVGSTLSPIDSNITTPINTLSIISDTKTGVISSLPLIFIRASPLFNLIIPPPDCTSTDSVALIPILSANCLGNTVKVAPVSTSALTFSECFLSESDISTSIQVCPIVGYDYNIGYINVSNIKNKTVSESFQNVQFQKPGGAR